METRGREWKSAFKRRRECMHECMHVCVCVCVCVCVHACLCNAYLLGRRKDTSIQKRTHTITVCVCVCVCLYTSLVYEEYDCVVYTNTLLSGLSCVWWWWVSLVCVCVVCVCVCVCVCLSESK